MGLFRKKRAAGAQAVTAKGFSRRSFLIGGAVAASASYAAVTLTGCSGTDADQKKEPEVITDDSKIVNVIDEYKEADAGLAAQAEWDLPLGTVPFHSEGSCAALLNAPESARQVNTLGILSLTSGANTVLVESP